MNEVEKKKPRLRGLPKAIAGAIEPLNSMETFKEKFKDTEVKILLNAKDGKYAALLVIDKGTIHVESIENKPKENLKKKIAGWDGLLETDMNTFLSLIDGGDITTGKVVKKILMRKVKIRGIKNVLVLLELFKL